MDEFITAVASSPLFKKYILMYNQSSASHIQHLGVCHLNRCKWLVSARAAGCFIRMEVQIVPNDKWVAGAFFLHLKWSHDAVRLPGNDRTVLRGVWLRFTSHIIIHPACFPRSFKAPSLKVQTDNNIQSRRLGILSLPSSDFKCA